MLTIGFKKAYFGLVDENTDMLTGDNPTDPVVIPGAKSGIYEMNAGTVLGVLSASITGLAPTTNKIYGSDVQVDISGQGTGNISVTFAANDIPMDVESVITGYSKNDMGGWYLDDTSRAPYGALDLVSTNRAGQPIHIAFLKGRFAPGEKTLTSNNDSPQWATDSLTFSAISRNNTDLRSVTRYIEDGVNITLNQILKDVFMGYEPVEAVPVTGVTLATKTLTGKVGDTGQLEATIAPATATDTTVQFLSSDSTIATIDNAGNYKFLKAGTVTFTVKTDDGGFTDQATATISAS